MCDFEHSTQLTEWSFTPSILAECRERANQEARIAFSNWEAPPESSSPNGNGSNGDNNGNGGGSLSSATPDAVTSLSNPDVVTSSAGEIKSNSRNNSPKPPSNKNSPKPPSSVSASNNKQQKKQKQEPLVAVQHHAAGYHSRHLSNKNALTPLNSDPWHTSPQRGSHPLLSPSEEELLIQFYAGKLPNLVGPKAQMNQLRREVKVVATAGLFFRRFYLSNSVMVHHPKSMMVACAFLACKVEDAMCHVRYLEDGTKIMQAPVTIDEIIQAELYLLQGINSDLMCSHPYKPVLAYIEDLRTYLKSDRGRAAVVRRHDDHHQSSNKFSESDNNNNDSGSTSNSKQNSKKDKNENDGIVVSGEDLRPIFDGAKRIVGDVVVSDLPLLYTPGQIGLAALIVANEDLNAMREEEQRKNPNDETLVKHPRIDIYSYVKNRFDGRSNEEHELLETQMKELSGMLRDLKKGKHGCGNHGIDIKKLKEINKKLKKLTTGEIAKDKSKDGKKKKKKKKRKAVDGEEGGGVSKKKAP